MESKKRKWRTVILIIFIFVLISLSLYIKEFYDSQESPSLSPIDRTGMLRSLDKKMALFIRSVTSGRIGPDDPIMIQFNREIVPEKQRESVTSAVFQFEPAIEGNAGWIDSRTLAFRPSKPLPIGQKYRAEVDLNKLITTGEQFDPVQLDFSVVHREVLILEMNPQITFSDQCRLSYNGRIEFNLETPQELLESGMEIKLGDQPVSVELKQTSDRTFTFATPEMSCDKRDRSFQLNMDAGVLHLKSDIRYGRKIAGDALEVEKIKSIVRDGQPTIRIDFSDFLDERQDLEGFFTISPTLEPSAKIEGNFVYLTGGFVIGSRYDIAIEPGIHSAFGTKMMNESTHRIWIRNLEPELTWLHEGAILPRQSHGRLQLRAINLRSVQIDVTRVYDHNLGYFLQESNLSSSRARSNDFSSYNLKQVGIPVAEQKIELTASPNQPEIFELDLAGLLDDDQMGLFIVSASFQTVDVLQLPYSEDESNPPEFDRLTRSFWESIAKPVIVSDLGLTMKTGGGRCRVFATNLISGLPEPDVIIRFMNYQTHVLKTAITDAKGSCEVTAKDVFYVTGEKGGMRSVLVPQRMSWDLSDFPVDGLDVSQEESGQSLQTRGYIYTDRGVHRPGDPVYISMIFRNSDGTFPDHHPIQLTITNPRDQKVLETTLDHGTDGFYTFTFDTAEHDPTGTYLLKVKAGAGVFTHTLRIETVVAEKYKVRLEVDSPLPDDGELDGTVSAQYLFGGQAARRPVKVELQYHAMNKKSPRFPGFSFDNAGKALEDDQRIVLQSVLDDEGLASFSYEQPDIPETPSMLMATFNAEVTEKSGRASTAKLNVPREVYDQYIGIKPPQDYLKTGVTHKIPVVMIDREDQPVLGQRLIWTLYRNTNWWWWHHGSRSGGSRHFKTDSDTEKISSGMLVTQGIPVDIEVEMERWGLYFLEVNRIDQQGHTAGILFNAGWYGNQRMSAPQLLRIQSDRDIFYPGDTAGIQFIAPPNSKALVTLERGPVVLDQFWYTPGTEIGSLQIPVTREMQPNIYCTVSVIQPYEVTTNDLPLRMYGLINLKVVDPTSILEVDLETPEVIRPESEFTCVVQTADHTQAQYTIAVVDEGLLSLTNFQTPDPWEYFNQKLRLGVQTSDNFQYVIGAMRKMGLQTYKIGGDSFIEGEEQYLPPTRAKRFKPVALYQGPSLTDQNGRGEVTFTMPEYIGAVRIMVVAARGGRFGSAHREIPVKTDLILSRSLPRVLAPGDAFQVPVTVINSSPDIDRAQVILDITGPIEITGSPIHDLEFDGPGENDVHYNCRVLPAVGMATFHFTVSGGVERYEASTEIDIRSLNPWITKTWTKEIEPGESVSFDIPPEEIEDAAHCRLTLSKRATIKARERLRWLIHYPYGCIEQTTSSVFPQLYLRPIFKNLGLAGEEIDRNIQSGINRLRSFQTGNGGFSYWPGEESVSHWGTSYTGHFLLEASENGYTVPASMLDGWKQYQRTSVNLPISSQLANDAVGIKVYQLFLLALAGEPDIGTMNVLRENSLEKLDNAMRWVLAASYHLAGEKEAAREIFRDLSTDVPEYRSLGWTYGSTFRDQSMILYCMTLMNLHDRAATLFDEVVKDFNRSDLWYSTQETSWALMAIGRYMQTYPDEFTVTTPIEGWAQIENQVKEPYRYDQPELMLPMDQALGKELACGISSEAVGPLFATLDWQGIPLQTDQSKIRKKLILKRIWYDESASRIIEVDQVVQGQEFWARLNFDSTVDISIPNMALVMILPSGWEVVNTRLTGEELPQNLKDLKQVELDYQDIRDDRVMWFFTLPPEYRRYSAHDVSQTSHSTDPVYNLFLKIRAVTPGRYELPPLRLEAMYDNDFQAVEPGFNVRVTPE